MTFWLQPRCRGIIGASFRATDMGKHTPTEIKLHRKLRQMEISFTDGKRCELPYEFLRVYAPSAEVRGHGAGQEWFFPSEGQTASKLPLRR